MGEPIGLAVPDRRKPARGSFDIRSRKVEQWLANLPKANLGETARMVFHSLVETNQLRYPYKTRIRFLEELRPTTQFVTTAMRKHFVGTAFPLPRKSQKIAAATREIYSELAIGYKIAIEDVLENRLFFTDKKLLAKLINRTISCLGRVLLTSYQVYAPYPSNTWSEINKLYQFAEANKLLRIEVFDEQRIFVKKSTINAEFCRIMLLSLASPYRLRQGEANKVHNTLERWAHKCHLFHIRQDKAVHGFFAVNLTKDEAPRNVVLVNQDCNVEDCRTMDTEQLADIIRDEIQNTQDVGETTITGIDMTRPDLSHDLLRRLLTAWAVIAKRSFPRTEKHEKVMVAIGLSAAHQIISDSARRRRPGSVRTRINDKSSNPFSHKAQYESLEVTDVNERQPDIWNLVYPSRISGYEPLDVNRASQIANAGAPDEVIYQSESWAILNESASGYCLNNTEGTEATVQVGEVMGIRRSGNGHTWKWGIGVIRWMKYSKEIGIILGVEMLNPDAAAVGIRAISDEFDRESYQRTLMLPQINAINQPNTLITPAVPYRVGHQVKLKILSKEMNIKLNKQLQNTGLFAQFQFDILDEKHKKQPGDDEWSEDDDFDNVWSSI